MLPPRASPQLRRRGPWPRRRRVMHAVVLAACPSCRVAASSAYSWRLASGIWCVWAISSARWPTKPASTAIALVRLNSLNHTPLSSCRPKTRRARSPRSRAPRCVDAGSVPASMNVAMSAADEGTRARRARSARPVIAAHRAAAATVHRGSRMHEVMHEVTREEMHEVNRVALRAATAAAMHGGHAAARRVPARPVPARRALEVAMAELATAEVATAARAMAENVAASDPMRCDGRSAIGRRVNARKGPPSGHSAANA